MPPLLGPGLVVRRVSVGCEDVVFVRGVIEASEGVGVLFAERGGELVIAAPEALEGALDELVDDLMKELCNEA
nr:MAG: hypothetical protein DIU78_11430 [Pseudomonadota bacterium]